MVRPSLRLLTLGELASNGAVLESLVAENETLFVEHKAGMKKGDGYQLAKAVGFFANTLGGWVLVGVRDGQVDKAWIPPKGGFVDAVRQKLEGQLDPLPSFAADVMKFGDDSLGIIRVYESTDTPHILLADGSVVVREPAQDAKLRKRGKYEATPIRSHYELAQLMGRGLAAEQSARERLAGDQLPLLREALGIRLFEREGGNGLVEFTPRGPGIVLRAAPLNLGSLWREWSVSRAGVEALEGLSGAVSDELLLHEDPRPHPTGASMSAKESRAVPWINGGHRFLTRTGIAVIDGGGGIGLKLGFSIEKGGGLTYDWRQLADDGQLECLLSPLLRATADTLAASELLGRYAIHLHWLRMDELFRLEPELAGEGSPPEKLECGGLLTVDGLSDRDEQNSLVRRFSEELLRASGVAVWRAN